MNSWEVEQGVSNALANRDAARRAGEGLGYLLPLAPVLVPAGWLGYSAFRFTADLAWHPMFSGIAGLVAAVVGLAGMGYAFALLPAGLWALVGSGVGAVLGWLFAHNGLQADNIWSGGAAVLGLLLGAGWFFLLSRGSAAMLQIDQDDTPLPVTLMALHVVVLILAAVAMAAFTRATYNPIGLVVGILAVGAMGLFVLRRLVAARFRKTAIALLVLQTAYYFPLSVWLSSALWDAAQKGPPYKPLPGFMGLLPGAMVILLLAMGVFVTLFVLWTRQSRAQAAHDAERYGTA